MAKPIRGPRNDRRVAAFTLIEVLVVVAIIAMLIAILLPSLTNARNQTKATVCMNHLRQIALAHLYYSLDHVNRLPGADQWLAARLSGGASGTSVYDTPPETGQLFGNQPSAKKPNRKPTKNYVFNKELYLCPLDEERRKQATQQVPKPFSYIRNGEIARRLVPDPEGPGFLEDRYVMVEKVRFTSRTPLLLEEYELAPMNDGEIVANDSDDLTWRHNGKAMISYHDFHVEPIRGKLYNDKTPEEKARFLAPGYAD